MYSALETHSDTMRFFQQIIFLMVIGFIKGIWCTNLSYLGIIGLGV